MDDRRFDDLVRSLSIRLPRRGLGPLAGGLLAALGLDDDADAGRTRRRRDDRDRDALARRPDPAGPEPAKKKKKKKKKKKPQPPPPSCSNFGAYCTSSYSCCGALYCYDGRCAYSGTNPCPDDQYPCGGTCSWTACCPTGQKLCDGACVAQSACCPACGAGQTCVNGSCTGGGTAGCAAGQKDCDGFCVPADACCPFCAVNQVCQGGVCQPLPCDTSALDACLETAVGFAESTAGTCEASCTDPDSAACDDCILDWLLGDDLDVAGCYSMACEVSGAGIDIPGIGANCRYRALHDCRADVKKKFRNESITTWYGKKVKAEVLDCIKFGDCSGVPKLEWKLITSVLGDRAKEYMGELSVCKGAFGCEGLYQTSPLTQYSFNCVNAAPGAIIDGRCCMKGQRWDGQGCCWDQGVECAQGHRGLWLQPVFGKCCGTGAGGYQKTCKRGTCDECLTQGAGRADGDECCLPDCYGKCGGDDGCGGTCPDACPQGQVCKTENNLCCRPDCAGKCGGDDGCGGTCPNWCPPSYICRPDTERCCQPRCDLRCGGETSDGCGGPCPNTCSSDRVCEAPGYSSCVCKSGVPNGSGCCPEGSLAACYNAYIGQTQCCDWPICEMSGGEVRNAGCCSAQRRYINAQGDKDCCPIWGLARGDGCCYVAGHFNPGYRPEECCSGELAGGPYCA